MPLSSMEYQDEHIHGKCYQSIDIREKLPEKNSNLVVYLMGSIHAHVITLLC